MPFDKEPLKRPFQQVMQGSHPEDTKHSVPEMIKKDRPAPRPVPPALASSVDKAHFQQQWQREMEAAISSGTFERGGSPQTSKHDFNQNSDLANGAEARLQSGEDRLAVAVNSYLQTRKQGEAVSEERAQHIEQLYFEAFEAGQQVNDYRHTGRTLRAPIVLGDAFDRADEQAKHRENGLGRERS